MQAVGQASTQSTSLMHESVITQAMTRPSNQHRMKNRVRSQSKQTVVDSRVIRVTSRRGQWITGKCDRHHSRAGGCRVKNDGNRDACTDPRNCPAPLQDPISRYLSGGPGIFLWGSSRKVWLHRSVPELQTPLGVACHG